MPRRPIATSSLLISHVVLIGLTPLIPIPILDDVVKAFLERRLTRELAAQHGIILSDDDVKVIAEGPGESIFASIGRGALLLPVRYLFRKIFFVLEVKRASDAASACFHRGYLLDAAFARGAKPPKPPAAALRGALDATVAETNHSPIGAAFGLVFEGSKSLLKQATKAILKAATGMGRAPTERAVRDAVDGAASGGPFDALVDRVRNAATTVPDAYFEGLERRFEARLNSLDR